ncbi:hypothetical protein VHEMI00118 [[Torrubiella] hemipterigena]|uniref:YAG7-like dimerisation domain-containing protein n=1 Tax=[Torrubiella] hemipterigena TaxID=1531966 RepID=A0A0A1T1A4_9HYPO|nr:hypothetical protein VHEMI00118 [[Torrubiella] hemipterigena]
MAAPTAQASKKKVAKALERTHSPAPSSVSFDKTADESDDGFESPYIKELHKNIRNVTKKISNASKLDAVLKSHPGKSLDDLVASKVINGDQKAQILKKPTLQAQLAQFEEQVAQYQKIHDQYRAQAESDKASVDKAVAQARTEALAEANAAFEKKQHDGLMVVSQFLRLAAYRREEAADPESDETQAIEGVLLAIYAGDESAVSSLLKLVNGTDDKVISVPGQLLNTDYATIKTLAQGYKAPGTVEEAPETEAAPVEATTTATETAADVQEAPAPTEEPANTASNGSADNATDLSISQEWIDVKGAEGDTGESSMTASQSWADDQPEPAPKPVADPNDGFHEVQRNKVRHEREGSNARGGGRGRGGRGGRGDGRGRGRGNNRSSGVPSRGPRRTDE